MIENELDTATENKMHYILLKLENCVIGDQPSERLQKTIVMEDFFVFLLIILL